MNILILLHSTTGNTRLVTRYAARYLETRGHTCTVHNIAREPDPPELSGVELLGVACPTFYFRASFAMERFIARLPSLSGERRPAFHLATCMGEPGAHFAILAELLDYKGFSSLGAHWVVCPSNWPPHLNLIRRLQWSAPLGDVLARRQLPLWARMTLGSLWPSCAEPTATDRVELESFLDRILERAQAGALDDVPSPGQLHRALPPCHSLGRMTTPESVMAISRPTIVAERCTGCGVCVQLCPVKTITQDEEGAVPRVGWACTGCFTCYNRCPDGAVLAKGSPAGVAQYDGPSARMRELFRSP